MFVLLELMPVVIPGQAFLARPGRLSLDLLFLISVDVGEADRHPD